MSPAVIEIDARGHRCPTPTLRLRRALAEAAPGTSVVMIADDPLARVDVAHFARAQGYDLQAVEPLSDGATTRFRVQKPPAAIVR